MRDSLADLFASIGIETATYGSPQELLSAGLPDRPSCLVLDLRLPGTSGLGLQERLAAMDVRVPIVFITGHGDIATTVRAMKAGAVDFLSKPFRQQELIDSVNAALRTDEARRAAEREKAELRALAAQLTPREIDVLRGVGRGLLNKQIAYELGVSEITVKMHRSSAGRKLKTRSVADLVQVIIQLGL